MKSLPFLLTTLRLLLSPVAVWCAYATTPRGWFAVILIAGILSDIFDGILARRLGVSTPALRRYDSLTDVAFWLCILAAAWLLAPLPIRAATPWIIVLLATEAACILTSLLRFSRFPATHSYLAKTYGLTLFVTFLCILTLGGPSWILPVLGLLGITANLEILAILLLAKSAPVDVPSIFHLQRALKISAD